jgi:hypothetical protein
MIGRSTTVAGPSASIPSGSHAAGDRGAARATGGNRRPDPATPGVASYSFADRQAPAFTAAGTLVPDDPRRRRTDWRELANETVNVEEIFYDIHCHMKNYTGRGHYIVEIFEQAKKLGIKHFTLICIPTTLSPLENDSERAEQYGDPNHPGPTYYLPEGCGDATHLTRKLMAKVQKKVELIVNPAVDEQMAAEVQNAVLEGELPPACLDEMALALTGLHLGNPRCANEMLKTLWRNKQLNDNMREIMIARRKEDADAPDIANHRLRFNLVGEVTVRKELVETLFAGESQANLTTRVAPVRQAMQLAGVIGMPWLLHCDVDKPEDLKQFWERGKRPQNIDDIKALMRSCPNTDIIWAHAGGLGRYVIAGRDHINELTALFEDKTLSHVRIDLSWSVVAEQLTKDEETRNRWAAFLVRWSDRIVFGSDTLTPVSGEKWTSTYDLYNEHLKPAMLALPGGQHAWDNIMKDNYLKLIVGSRERIDAFVDYVLEDILAQPQHFSGEEMTDVKEIQAYRDEVYARHQNDPQIQRACAHFRDRETVLPPIIGKQREHKRTKGTLAALSGGRLFQNYAVGSGRSGDLNAHRERKDALQEIRAQFNRIQNAVGHLRLHRDYTELSTTTNLLHRKLWDIEQMMGTSMPPVMQLQNLSDALDQFTKRVESALEESRGEVAPEPERPKAAGAQPADALDDPDAIRPAAMQM